VGPSTELPHNTTLWRGAVPKGCRGLSWTDDRDKAVWFAERFNGGSMKTGYLYRLEVTPAMVLARFSESRNEREWVLSPEALEDTEPLKEGV
jgi:hypothetical protein